MDAYSFCIQSSSIETSNGHWHKPRKAASNFSLFWSPRKHPWRLSRYSTFIYYLLCMTLYFKYSRPSPMDDQESHFTHFNSMEFTSHDAHCIALHPFRTEQAQRIKLTSFLFGVLLATTLLASISVFPWNLRHRRSLEVNIQRLDQKASGWFWSWFINLDFPWYSWRKPWTF